MIPSNRISVGLDIADRSIAVAALSETDNGFELSNRGRVELPQGVVQRGVIKDEKRLSDAIHEVFVKAQLQPFDSQTEITFALPEGQVYFHFFDLPMDRLSEREQLVRETAVASIPLPANDLLYSYKVLAENEQKMEILMTAASRTVVAMWRNFFEKIHLNVIETLDIEPLAIRRGLFLEPSAVPVCVVDIGAVTSDIDIFDAHGLRYAYSALIAGDAFTHEIAKVAKTSWEEAEDMKVRLGLTKGDNNVLSILVKVLEPLRDEVKTALNYFKEKTGERVGEIILVGGSSQLKGLVDYFAINLDLPVRLGEPVTKSEFRTKVKSKTTKRGTKSRFAEANNDFFFIEAIGLARRAFPGWWDSSDPFMILTQSDGEAADSNILTMVEQAVRKEEVMIKNVISRVWRRKGWLFSSVFAGIAVIGLAYWYWLYKPAPSPQFEDLSNKITNEAANFLVIPEQPPEDVKTQYVPEGDGEPANQEENSQINPAPTVLIANTPTGWLNVRSGPGTNNPILTKVYPGKSYPLLMEQENWYKIKVDSNTEGWVINQYATKQ